MAKSLLALLFLALFYTSYANAGYDITFPGTGNSLQNGTLANATWTISTDGPTESLVDVILYSGPPESLQAITTLCKDIDPKLQKCDFTVPANSLTKIDYAITVGKLPDNYAYSSYFTIEGAGEIPPNNGCPNMGGHLCESVTLACCSSTGFCGKGSDFCGVGCQQQFSMAGACTKDGSTDNSTDNSTDYTSVPKRRRLSYY